MHKFCKFLVFGFKTQFAHFSSIFVTILISLIFPFIFSVFWIAAIRQNPHLAREIDVNFIVSYFGFAVFFNAISRSQIHDYVSQRQIYGGQLDNILLKPYSYFVQTICRYIANKVIRGAISIVFLVLVLKFAIQVNLNLNALNLLAIVPVMFLNFLIAITLTMCVGFMAFWATEIRTFSSLYEVAHIMLAGTNIPLFMAPQLMQQISNFTPFPYFVYHPTMLLLRPFSANYFSQIILAQLFWLAVVVVLYRVLFYFGIKKYENS